MWRMGMEILDAWRWHSNGSAGLRLQSVDSTRRAFHFPSSWKTWRRSTPRAQLRLVVFSLFHVFVLFSFASGAICRSLGGALKNIAQVKNFAPEKLGSLAFNASIFAARPSFALQSSYPRCRRCETGKPWGYKSIEKFVRGQPEAVLRYRKKDQMVLPPKKWEQPRIKRSGPMNCDNLFYQDASEQWEELLFLPSWQPFQHSRPWPPRASQGFPNAY